MRHKSIFPLALLLTACAGLQETEPEEFAAPEVIALPANLSDKSVTVELSGSIKGANTKIVKECGFVVSNNADMSYGTRIQSYVIENFSTQFTCKDFGTTYYYHAFISNGQYFISSKTKSFEIAPFDHYVTVSKPEVISMISPSLSVKTTVNCADGINLDEIGYQYSKNKGTPGFIVANHSGNQNEYVAELTLTPGEVYSIRAYAKCSDNVVYSDAIVVNNPIRVVGISLNKTSLDLIQGSTETLKATVTPFNAYDKTVIWSSSDSNVATVDSNGKVTAIAPGSTTITAITNDGGYKTECMVTVTSKITGISLNKTSMSLSRGESEYLTATVSPSDADQTVTWTTTNSGVATVDGNGKVTAVAPGTATIIVTTKGEGYSATCKVTVTSKITGISLNKTTLSLIQGNSETLNVTVTPSDATNKTVSWSSSNTNVAIVTSNGTVKGISQGMATIKATSQDGGFTATCGVTVKSLESLKGYHNNHEYIDLGLSVKWALYNIGGSESKPIGKYYLWGDANNSGVIASYNPPYVSNICGTSYDSAKYAWGGNWRMPTMQEFRELVNNCQFEPAISGGVNGLKVTGPSGGSMFLPATGMKFPADGPIGSESLIEPTSGFYFSGEADMEYYIAFARYYEFLPDGSTSSSYTYNAMFVKMVIRPVLP